VVDVRPFTEWSTGTKVIAAVFVAIVIGYAVSSVGGAGTDGSTSPSPSQEREDETNATITDVVDGDTVRANFVGDVVAVRLIGVDAPEVGGPFTTLECFGPQASAYTTRLLDGQRIRLELDVEEHDRFGRTLAYVWLGDVLFNEELVDEGFAFEKAFPPNVAYVDRLRSAEQDAREHNRGLWGACSRPGS
jgi:micrococcal nuclease